MLVAAQLVLNLNKLSVEAKFIVRIGREEGRVADLS
jgi:hypothetical protein